MWTALSLIVSVVFGGQGVTRSERIRTRLTFAQRRREYWTGRNERRASAWRNREVGLLRLLDEVEMRGHYRTD